MITMNEIFEASTPPRILRILELMNMRTVTIDDIFDTNKLDAKRKHRALYLSNKEEFYKLVENIVKIDLKYLEKLDIFLSDKGVLFSKS